MLEDLETLKSDFFLYARRRGADFDEFPLGTKPDNFFGGGRHLEIKANGRFAIVGTDRKIETERRETYSKSELFNWLIELYA
ncbi:hypothetical protein PVA19_12720 [Agrobacterium sp. CNPSo 3708]|uniref:hypothetical protein n=1 Tax=Agrobacterium sp. CNPSo 3708 TaxID=3028150 RepID=UPI0023646AF0|nr:hypothetical protein [Agrobacterium sp. CNPSo 3708]MDD1499279.1 hypothetical protein [Agrobacterium sp. CNPSo 3708]